MQYARAYITKEKNENMRTKCQVCGKQGEGRLCKSCRKEGIKYAKMF